MGGRSLRRRRSLCSAFRIPRSDLVPPADLIQLFQSHQHIPRLGPIRGSEDPCQLQLIDYPRRSPVADAHAPLQQRGRAELVLDAHLRGLPEQHIALARSALLALPASVFPCFFRVFQRRHLVVDARARDRRGLRGMGLVPVHQSFGLVRRDEGPCTRSSSLLPGGRNSMSPFPSMVSAPFWSRMVRLSTLAETRNAIRQGKFALMSPVMTFTDGRWVASTR